MDLSLIAYKLLLAANPSRYFLLHVVGLLLSSCCAALAEKINKKKQCAVSS